MSVLARATSGVAAVFLIVASQPARAQSSSSAGPADDTTGSCSDAWRGFPLGQAYVRAAWRESVLQWARSETGLIAGVPQSRVTPEPGDDYPAQTAYNVAFAFGAAVDMAAALHDRPMADDLVAFYLAYAPRFESVSEILRRHRVRPHLLSNTSARILASRVPGDTSTVDECPLCSSQFLYPASRLMRELVTAKFGSLTADDRRFLNEYAGLIVHDGLARWIRGVNRNYWRAPDLDSSFANAWKRLAAPDAAHAGYHHAVTDTDLWMIAMIGEVLDANRRSPALVPMSDVDRRLLKEAEAAGVDMLWSRADWHAGASRADGTTLASLDFFEGEMEDHPDYAFAGDSMEQLPTQKHLPTPGVVGWDVSHATRIPQVLASLHRTMPDLVPDSALRLLGNQLANRALRGGSGRPLLTNFLDGTNGWYRVGYHGADFGYPPSEQCDSRGSTRRPCLTTFGFVGWGQLGDASPNLCRALRSVADLAVTSASGTAAFAARHYTFLGEPFAATGRHGESAYPLLLFTILAESAGQLH